MADFDEISIFRALADTDIGKKISSMTEEELGHLIETELSRLSDEELELLLAPVCRVVDTLCHGISDIFTELGEQFLSNVVAPFFALWFCGLFGMMTLGASLNAVAYIYKWWSNKRLQSSKLTTNAAKKQRKPLKRSTFSSKYTSDADQGLKCIGKIYIQVQVQETAKDVRQEVEQHQEATSRAVVSKQ